MRDSILKHRFQQLRAEATYENRHYTQLMLAALLHNAEILVVEDHTKGTLALVIEHGGKRYGGEEISKEVVDMLNRKAREDPTRWSSALEFLCLRWLPALQVAVFKGSEN